MTTPGVQAVPGSEVVADVTSLLDRKKFSAVDYIKNGGVVLPKGKIKLYLNVEACYRAQEITEEVANIEAEYGGSIAGAPPELIEPLQAERTALAELNEKTTMTFYLRGVHPAIDNLLKKKLNVNSKKRRKAGEDDDESWEQYVGEFLAKAIQHVELGSGEIDDHTFSIEEVLETYNSLPEDQAKRLWIKADELTHVMGLSDIVVDAGFPGGSNGNSGTGEPESAAARVGSGNVG